MKNLFLKFLRTPVFFYGLLLLSFGLLCECQSDKKSQNNPHQKTAPQFKGDIHHAVGFDLIEEENYQILHIFRHYNETADTLSYVLANKGAVVPEEYNGLKQIQVPVANIALLHSSYVSYFNFCDATDHIKAISEVKYVFDEPIYQAVQDGALPEVGYGETLNKEQLLVSDIDLVVTVGWPNSPNKSQHVLDELGIPTLIFSDWQESTLLGRAEWVKVIAALTGKSELVSENFDEIAQAYDSLKNLTKEIAQKPKVICNLPYKGSWYVPGGDSYVSNLLQDAGGTYLWADDQGAGGLQLDFEAVYAKGINADFWINPDFSSSIEDIFDKDERLREFRSVQSEKVFNSINKIARDQANDYWESGIMNPHLILADMIRILHPELLPKHQLVYYKQIF